MAYNIPLTGQIRLGQGFNRMRNPTSTTWNSQISMNDVWVREQHKGYARYGSTTGNNTINGLGLNAISPINPAANSQRNLYLYRGCVMGHPQSEVEMTAGNTSSWWTAGDQWWWYEAGSILNNIYCESRVHHTGTMGGGTGTGSTVDAGTIVQHTSVRSTSTSNAAIANTLYIGYLEAVTYLLKGVITQRYAAQQLVVRGYTGAKATGSSTDYKQVANAIPPTNGSTSWNYIAMNGATAYQFTVNATYPYVLLILQTNTSQRSSTWCHSSNPCLHTTYLPALSSYSYVWTEPHITRIS